MSLRIGQSQPNKNIFANLANHAVSKKVDSMLQKQAVKVRKKRPRSQEHSIGLTMCVFLMMIMRILTVRNLGTDLSWNRVSVNAKKNRVNTLVWKFLQYDTSTE